VFLGVAYRALNWISDAFKWKNKQCYSINRGQGMSAVESCVGEALFY